MVTLLTMAAWLPILAQEPQPHKALPSDLRASLMIAAPGEGPVSCYGHCALRLVCPSLSKDYFFTYGFADTADELLHLAVGKAAAHFWIMEPHRYLADYADEGRMVWEYRLNLTIEEIRRLWMLLDQASHANATEYFDPVRDHCSSACLRKIEECLGSGSIVWGKLPATAGCTYREFLTIVSQSHPWAGFLWKTFLGTDGDEKSPLQICLSPDVVAEAMAHARIEEPDGSRRPLLCDGGRGKAVCLGDDSVDEKATIAVSPLVTATFLAVMAVILAVLEGVVRRHVGNGKAVAKRFIGIVSTVFDVPLLFVHTCFSAFFMVVTLAPQLHSAHGNVRLMVFNIMPALVTLVSAFSPTFRRSNLSRRLWLLMATVCIVFAASCTWSPQIEAVYVLLAITFAARCVAKALR